MKHVGIVSVSYEALHVALRLPAGTAIRRVIQQPFGQRSETFEIVLEGPSMPECPEGNEIQRVDTVCTYDLRDKDLAELAAALRAWTESRDRAE